MNKGPLGKILICGVSFSMALCAYLHARNDVTKLMIQLPKLSKELSLIQEQNTILQFEVEKFENPAFLLNLLKTTEYAHLLSKESSQTIALEVSKDAARQVEEVLQGSRNALLGTVR